MDFSELPLRDIHLPAPVGWWPPAPGWWVVAAVVLLAAAAYAYRYYCGRYRRAALRAVVSVRDALQEGAEPVTCVQGLSTLLRRYAMTTASADAADSVPGLVGESWLRYLDRCWQREGFVMGRGRALLAAPYAPPESIDRGTALELIALCEAWLQSQPIMGRAHSSRAASES